MIALWNRIVEILDRREAPTSLALVRISVGCIVWLHTLRMWYIGVPAWVWADFEHGGMRELNPGFLERFGGLTPENVNAMTLFTSLCGFLLALGVGGRVMALVTLFSFDYLADLNSHSGGSYDELVKNILFCTFLSEAHRGLSWKNLWKKEIAPVLIPSWPRYLLVFQLVLIYWTTALQKVSASWIPIGELDALWYILQQPTWGRYTLPFEKMVWLYPVTQAMTLSVWCWEQAAPLLLLSFWYRETRTRKGWVRAAFNASDFRTLYLLFGVGMHVGIESLMEVGSFSMASMTLYFACYHPDELHALVGWFKSRWSPKRPAAT